jgi:uncharacterized repeat protein (TIGR03803 family)
MAPSNWLRSLRNTRERYSGRKTRPIRKAALGRKLLLELLEDRTLPSAYMVTNTLLDGGSGSLRDAINQINEDVNPDGSSKLSFTGSDSTRDEIDFQIPWNSPTHFYYKDDGIAGQVTAADITQVPTIAIDGSTPITRDAQLADPSIVGIGNTIDPDQAHSWWSITPQSGLPKITNTVIINGFSQPGSSANTMPNQGLGAGDNAVQTIVLDGIKAGASEALLIAGGNSTVEGLQIQNFANGGIHLLKSGNDSILGNKIQNTGGDGGSPNDIFFFGGATCVYIDGVSGNTIGGTTPDKQNELAVGDAVEIAGAGGAASNNQVLGNLIGTDGTAVLPSDFGIFIIDASDNTISKNVIAGGGVSAIEIYGGGVFGSGSNPSGNVIQGNFINTDPTGSKALISGGYFGIGLDGVVSNTLIGGPTDSARNVISGGSFVGFCGGIGIGATYSGGFVPDISGTVIERNYIGVDATGTRALAEQEGSIGILSGGWPALIEDNHISGWGTGIVGGTIIQGNWIGTDSTGKIALPNGTGIDSGGQIGGTISGQGNIIAFNNGAGVSGGGPIEGNSIYSNVGPGITVRGQGVFIEGNSIYGNGQLGIVLGGGGRIAGVNTNASNNQANHQGPNNLMNFPVLTSVQTSATGTIINGTLSTGTANGKPFLPNATITLDFYANLPSAVDPSGYGQGQYWLGSTTITTDANGNVPFFSADFSAASILAASTAWPNVPGGVFLPPIPNGVLPAGWFVSATTTDANGNTSEFSAVIPVGPTSGGPYTIAAGNSATVYAAAGPGTSPAGYFWTINGQGYGSPSSCTGYNPTLTWAQLQSLGIAAPGTYSVQANWVDSSNNVTALPATALTVQTAPVTAAITTALPTNDSGNPTTAGGTPITLNSIVTDPNTGNAVPSYAWSVVKHTLPAALGTALVHTTQYATRDLGESSNASFLALGAPDGPGWVPDGWDRSSPYLTLGYDTPMYVDGVTIWENAGLPPHSAAAAGDYNGFVTRIDLLDTNGEYHTVWSGVDPTHSIAETPFELTWTQTTYLVEAVRVYSTNYISFNSGIVSNRTDIDAVQVSGSYDPAVNRGRSDQYATSVLAAASSPDYGGVNLGSETSWGAANVVGAPNVLAGNVNGDNGDDPLAWSPAYENSNPNATPPIPADQTLAVGFAIPVYADGVTIREAEGNGFVTEVEALDTNGHWHTVWTGTDPTLPGTPADFRVNWTETTYLVSAVRIHVNIDHNLNSYEDIDSVQLHGWFTSGTLVPSGSGQTLNFTPSDTNATYFATLTATDSLDNIAMAQTTIDVAPAVPPTAHITNPSYSAGKVSLTLTASNPSLTDQASSFTIDWGDGPPVQTISATNGSATPTHAYAAAGTYLVTVIATDTAGMISPIATAVVGIDSTPGDAILLGGGVSPGQVNIGTAGTAGGPTGGLIADNSGNLYGISGGGAFNDGTVFELPYQSSTQTYGPITTLFSFNGADGANLGALAFYNGNLFGTTNTGGASGQGTIFELDLGSDTLTTLVTFNGTNGAYPAALITDSSGNLYGTTSNGGTTNDGTVFKLPYNNLTHMYGPLSTLVTFDGTNGASPGGSQALITDTSGNLYGTTRPGNFGYGTVFKLPYNNLTQTYSPLCTLVTFNRTNGAYPMALITDTSGNLYGTTEVGGSSDAGTVFKLPYNNLTQTYGPLSTLVTFNGTNGVDPVALVTDSSGNLYGTTGGGTIFDGSVFELSQGSYTFSTLATFNGSDGSGPNGLVPEEYNGNVYLYGTTGLGGATGNGTFFQVQPANQTLTPLASFTGNAVAMYSPTDLVFVAGLNSANTYTVNFGPTLTTQIDIAGAGGSLTANGADGDNDFNKVTGNPNQLSWAPVYGAATPAETVNFSGTSTTILVGGSGNNYYKDPGSGTTIVGGPAANTFVITATAGSGVTLVGGPSTNNYIIDLGNLAGPVTIQNGNPGAADSLTVIGAPGNNTITASGNQVTEGTQTITFSQPLTKLTIAGGSGNNQLIVSTITVPVQKLALNGGGGNNTFTLNNVGSKVAGVTITPGSGGPGTNQVQVQGALPATSSPVPTVGAVNGPASVIPGQTVTLTAPYSVSGPASTESVAWNWGDGTTTTQTVSAASGTLSASHTYATARATPYGVTLTMSDSTNGLVTQANFATTVTQSIYVLNTTASGAVSVSGNATITIPGNLIVDSSSTKALTESGNAKIAANSIQVVGGVSQSGNATLSPAATIGVTVVADPLAGRTGPSITGVTNYGSVSLSGNKTQTLNPGIYTSISASGNASMTLSSGIYIIEGGGFTVTGNASVSGSGVMIYNTGSNYPSNGGNFGGITLSGNGTVSLTAPTSGTYAGIVIFQPSANTRAISLSGNAANGLTGTVYAPAALLTLSGNATLNGAVVVNQLSLSGNANSTLSVDGSNGSSGTAGQLLAGNLLVYVNDPSGLFTSDELARIQDAVSAVDATVEPFAVSVTETTDSTAANVIVDTGGTSAAGGYADGVLACYTSAGEITLIQGWSWYAGADATAIGATQYDFETAVLHELGHALGLGHSGATSSDMYATLAAGVSKRNLTTTDLAIPAPGAGAEPLSAAVLPARSTEGVAHPSPVTPGTPPVRVGGQVLLTSGSWAWGPSGLSSGASAVSTQAAPSWSSVTTGVMANEPRPTASPATLIATFVFAPASSPAGGGEEGPVPTEQPVDPAVPSDLRPDLDGATDAVLESWDKAKERSLPLTDGPAAEASDWLFASPEWNDREVDPAGNPDDPAAAADYSWAWAAGLGFLLHAGTRPSAPCRASAERPRHSALPGG